MFEAKEAAAPWFEAREEYQLAFVLSNSLMEHHLSVDKSGDGKSGDE